jgi:hypothetical protein
MIVVGRAERGEPHDMSRELLPDGHLDLFVSISPILNLHNLDGHEV